MALSKEKGVNPASGCLPMLLTMPVLFAFYSLLSVAIEMRGAPFALWIRDLSTHDPLYITPLHHGRDDVLAAADHADRRSGTGQGDDAHADHVPVLLPVGTERAGRLLDGEQPARHRPAVRHQAHDRSAGGEAGPPACGAPDEDCRSGRSEDARKA